MTICSIYEQRIVSKEMFATCNVHKICFFILFLILFCNRDLSWHTNIWSKSTCMHKPNHIFLYYPKTNPNMYNTISFGHIWKSQVQPLWHFVLWNYVSTLNLAYPLKIETKIELRTPLILSMINLSLNGKRKRSRY